VAHSENKTAYDSKKNRVKRQEKEGEKDRGTKRAVEEKRTILTMMTAIATKTMKHRTTVIWKKLVMTRVKAAKMTRRMTRRKGRQELERATEGGECGDNALPLKLTVHNLPFDATRHDLFEIFLSLAT
jgi:hypothetical protein